MADLEMQIESGLRDSDLSDSEKSVNPDNTGPMKRTTREETKVGERALFRCTLSKPSRWNKALWWALMVSIHHRWSTPAPHKWLVILRNHWLSGSIGRTFGSLVEHWFHSRYAAVPQGPPN